MSAAPASAGGEPSGFREAVAFLQKGQLQLSEQAHRRVLEKAPRHAPSLHHLGLIAFNQAKITEKGHIGLFQVKLEFPAANNTIRIPLSFSYSNRTELIKESQVRGQVGVSLNLDGLFAGK